jgi:PAS domain S-box-containing protein
MQHWHSRFLFLSVKSVAWLAIITVLAISLLALTGWLLDLTPLKSILPQWVTMKITTAICLALLAIELAFLNKSPANIRKRILLQAPGMVVGLVGLITIILYLAVIITGREPLSGSPLLHSLFWAPATRMALLTAILFLFSGGILTLLASGGRRNAGIAHALMAPMMMVSYLVPVSYLLNVQDLHESLHVAVALHTGISFCAFGVAVFCIRPDTWLMKVFTGDHAGSLMARRLMPGLLILPLLIGWLRLYGERTQFFTSEVGVTLVVLSYTFCFFWLMWLSARSVNVIDDRRRQTEDDLRKERDFVSAVLNTAGAIVIVLNRHGKITGFNRACEEITGYSVTEVMNRVLWEFLVPPEDLEGVKKAWEKLHTGSFPNTHENHWIAKDGSRRLIAWSNTILPDTVGKVDYIIGTGIDITEQRQAETALREREEQLRLFVEHAPAAIAMLDRQMYYVAASNRWLTDFGLTGQNIIGRNHHDVLSDIPERWEEVLRRCLAGATEHAEEDRFDRADGTVQWLQWAVHPWRSANGSIGGVVIFSEDITGKKRAVEEILKSQQDLNRAQAVAHTGSWRMDVQHNRLIWSDENHLIFGIHKGTPLTYETFLSTIHPDDRDYVDGMWMAALRGEPYDIEHRLIVDGAVRWVRERAELEFDENGVLLGGFGTTQDISERKVAEDTIKKNLERLEIVSYTANQLLQSEAPQSIIKNLCQRVMEHLDCHVFFNFLVIERTARLHLNAYTGIPKEEAHKIEWLDYGVAVSGRVILEGHRIVAEHIPTTPDVQTDLVKSYGIKAYACHPIMGPGEKILGTLSFGTRSRETFSEEDISLMKAITDQVAIAMERRLLLEKAEFRAEELERRVQERTAELSRAYGALQTETEEHKRTEKQLRQSQKMEAIGTLAGGIAHDFNNIIAGIIGFIEMVMEDLDDGSAQHRRLSNALKGAHRGRDLVKQILSFSRLTEQEMQPVSMGLIIQECLKLLRASIPATIEIRFGMLFKDDVILGDATQIHQVIINLCSNAAYAMREKGGTIEISLTDEHIDSGHTLLAQNELQPGDYIRLSIEDTGCGMEPAIVERIFEPFFTTKEVGEGTGLGLSVVHGIVKRHNGTIKVYSRPGKGTAFHVYLPKDTPHEVLQTEVNIPLQGGDESILVVDDEELLVEMSISRLERLGYKTVGATSGIDALEIFRADPEKFDLIITDYSMPGMTGFEFAKEILTLKPGTSIVLCSGLNEPVSADQISEIGIQEFFSKPISKDDFAHLVRRVFNKRK